MAKKTNIFAVFAVIFVAMTTVVFGSGSLSNNKEVTTATVVTTTETASKVQETTTKKAVTGTKNYRA